MGFFCGCFYFNGKYQRSLTISNLPTKIHENITPVKVVSPFTEAGGNWALMKLEPGKTFHKPKPLFQKLDEAVAEEER
jgi:hypothetical protein